MEIADSTVKSTEIEPETFTNGLLKLNAPPSLHHHHHHHPVVVTYGECLKNHAASLGGHAVDGCGEFLPSPEANSSDPTSLKCAACGCHRNFHRRDPEHHHHLPPLGAVLALEYRPHHRHLPPLPDTIAGSPSNSPSPPPISSSYYPSLMALTHPISDTAAANSVPPSSRKRFRTKFTQDQKRKMLEFAEKLEWKMQKRDEDAINNFCNEIGVHRSVFKVWMHNNKHIYSKRDHLSSAVTSPISAAPDGKFINPGLPSAAAGSYINQAHFEEMKENITDHHL